jgi:phenylalanyl-tRNA synthetase beta subunit
LTRFGLAKSDSVSRPHWKIPSYRRDLQREVDLIEEIIRAHGIEKIPSADRSRFTPLSEADRNFDFETKLAPRSNRHRFNGSAHFLIDCAV